MWNFASGLNGPSKIGEFVMYLCGKILQNLLWALENWHYEGHSPSKEMFTKSPDIYTTNVIAKYLGSSGCVLSFALGAWKPEWLVDSLWPSDDIWCHWSLSTLIQEMAWCLMAPSHYLNQCWIIISEVLWHSPWDNFTGNAQDEMNVKITLRLQPHVLGPMSKCPQHCIVTSNQAQLQIWIHSLHTGLHTYLLRKLHLNNLHDWLLIFTLNWYFESVPLRPGWSTGIVWYHAWEHSLLKHSCLSHCQNNCQK